MDSTNNIDSINFSLEDDEELILMSDSDEEVEKIKAPIDMISDINLNEFMGNEEETLDLNSGNLDIINVEEEILDLNTDTKVEEEEELTLELGEMDEVSNMILNQSSGINLGSALGSFLIRPEEEISDEELRQKEIAEELNLEISVPDLETYANDDNAEELEDTSKESETRSKKLLIKSLQRVRSNVTPAESREILHGIWLDSTEQVKEYINNIHNGFNLESVGHTKQSAHAENGFSFTGAGKFFSLLCTMYQHLCIEASADNQEYMTPDEFMVTDLKTKLLSYGNRLGDLFATVEKMERVTASDVLSNEFLVRKLRDKLKEVRDSVERANQATDSEKATLSSIRTHLTRKYIPNTLRDKKKNYAYVSRIILSNGKDDFVCGECGKTSHALYPFYSLGVLPFQGRVKGSGNAYQAIDIPYANECEHCHTMNILTEEEIKRLAKATIKLHKALLDDYCKSVKELCTSFAMTRYRGSEEVLAKALPIVYSEMEEDDDLDEVAADSHVNNANVVSDAYERYREMLGYFETSADFEEYPTKEELSEVINVGDIGTRFITNVDLRTNRAIQQTETYKINLTNTVKVLCTTLGVKYKDAKRNAINSIIMNIRNTKLYEDLAYETTEVEKIIVKSREIKNYIEDLDPIEQTKIISSICGTIDYKYADIVDESADKLKKENLAQFQEAMDKYYDEHEKISTSLLEKKKKLIADLKDNIRIYAFIPLATIPVLTDAEGLLYDKEFVEFVNETADLLVLMNLSERFFKYWKTALSKTDANTFSSLADINKTKNYEYCIKLLARIGICKFQPRSKTTDKNKILMDIFTLLRDIDFEQLARLDSVRQAYQEGDMFTLMYKINDCDFFENLLAEESIDGYVYDTPIYKPIREMITSLLPITRDFIRKYGRSEEDRLRYYLQDLFSEEEIVSINAKRYKSIKFNVLLKKEENETIVDYLKRLSETSAKAPKECILDHTFEYQKEVDAYEVLLLSCNYPLMFLENNVKQIKEILTVIDLLYQIGQRNLGKVMNIMRIDADVANKLIKDSPNVELNCLNKEKEDAKNYLLRSTFLINAFNYSGNMADMDVSNDSADSSLDLGGNEEDRLKAIISDSDKFDEASKHLPEEVKKLINEYYTIGR